ncbi:battenin-like [Notothenia coriiceps]|uniref:Battenin-like n=1 Tax=Notothenia coriiceps TaxID=8208 RepID=A0A6I9MQ40_9TELE|nr:PREDICTED: battenin-like [Notothenia coriiceps]XP_010766522.1 PREDICTED: battenin-like [Notothenia coriiceps]
MLVVPFAMLISYFFLLAPPPTLPQWREKQYAAVVSEERQQLMDDSEEEEQGESTPGNRSSGPLTPKEKLHVIRGLMRFVFPLGLVYFAEYFINQGLMELLYFPNVFLSHAEQYRWSVNLNVIFSEGFKSYIFVPF